jgi:hypothetical protein
LNFTIEENTLSAALDCAHLLKNVSRERIFTELKKAVLGENFEIFSDLIICGGLEFLNVNKLPNYEKIKKHHDNPLLCLYLTLDSASLDKLKPSNIERGFWRDFDKLSKLPTPKNKADIKEMLNLCDSETVKSFFRLQEWDKSIIDEILKNNEPYKITHLAIGGKTLTDLGYKGEKIGEILEHLRRIVVANPQKNNPQDLINEIP